MPQPAMKATIAGSNAAPNDTPPAAPTVANAEEITLLSPRISGESFASASAKFPINAAPLTAIAIPPSAPAISQSASPASGCSLIQSPRSCSASARSSRPSTTISPVQLAIGEMNSSQSHFPCGSSAAAAPSSTSSAPDSTPSEAGSASSIAHEPNGRRTFSQTHDTPPLSRPRIGVSASCTPAKLRRSGEKFTVCDQSDVARDTSSTVPRRTRR